jgi:hypothetical protein
MPLSAIRRATSTGSSGVSLQAAGLFLRVTPLPTLTSLSKPTKPDCETHKPQNNDADEDDYGQLSFGA